MKSGTFLGKISFYCDSNTQEESKEYRDAYETVANGLAEFVKRKFGEIPFEFTQTHIPIGLKGEDVFNGDKTVHINKGYQIILAAYSK